MPDLPIADIERLLRESRDEVGFPPTPNIAGRALSRLQSASVDRRNRPQAFRATSPQRLSSDGTTTPIPLDDAQPRRTGQIVRLVAAMLAFVVVGAFLVALFELATGNGDKLGAPAGDSHDRLYTLAMTDGSTSRFSAWDVQTGDEIYAVDLDSYASQVVRSPDGETFYLLADSLYAIHAADGHVSRMAADPENPGYYAFGGPSSLTISPDGRWLYVYRYYEHGQVDAGTLTYGVQVIDTQTGTTAGETEQWSDSYYADDHCTPQTHAAPNSSRLYQFCWGTRRIKVVDLATGSLEEELTVAGDDTIDGSIQSPDGRFIYAVSTGPVIEVFDLATGQTIATHNLAPGEQVEINRPLLALSDDGTQLAIGLRTPEQGDRIHDVGRVMIVDTSSWTTVADIHVEPLLPNSPKWPDAMAFSADGTTLLMVGRNLADGTVFPYTSSFVVAIDIATGARHDVLQSTDTIERIFSGRQPSADEQ